MGYRNQLEQTETDRFREDQTAEVQELRRRRDEAIRSGDCNIQEIREMTRELREAQKWEGAERQLMD